MWGILRPWFSIYVTLKNQPPAASRCTSDSYSWISFHQYPSPTHNTWTHGPKCFKSSKVEPFQIIPTFLCFAAVHLSSLEHVLDHSNHIPSFTTISWKKSTVSPKKTLFPPNKTRKKHFSHPFTPLFPLKNEKTQLLPLGQGCGPIIPPLPAPAVPAPAQPRWRPRPRRDRVPGWS